jgi:hypothetical protein
VNADPEIHSVGIPPDNHANRIIGLMLQQMARRHAQLWEAVNDLARNPHLRDGSPKAQGRLKTKIEALGVAHVKLNPGKRGKYSLTIYNISGWDAERDTLIDVGDRIPTKPWITGLVFFVEGLGHGDICYKMLVKFFITHHALSRSAQRWGVRTVADPAKAIDVISDVVWEHILKHSRDGDNRWLDIPENGLRLPVIPDQPELEDIVIVVKRHSSRDALIVTTVLN